MAAPYIPDWYFTYGMIGFYPNHSAWFPERSPRSCAVPAFIQYLSFRAQHPLSSSTRYPGAAPAFKQYLLSWYSARFRTVPVIPSAAKDLISSHKTRSTLKKSFI